VGIRCADHATTSTRKFLALTSPTSGGRSVGIVCLRTTATEFVFCLYLSSPSYRCYMSLQLHPPPFDHPINIWRRIRSFSLYSYCHHIAVTRCSRAKYSPQYPKLSPSQFCSFSHEIPRKLHKNIPSDKTVINISRSKEIGLLEICCITRVNIRDDVRHLPYDSRRVVVTYES
jgi:hypothetical protein